MKQCTCSECPHRGEWLDENNFYSDAARADGLDNKCITCRKRINKDWALRNQEAVVNQTKRYYEENRERLCEYAHTYYEKNKEKMNKYSVDYYHAHQEAINAWRRAYRRRKKLEALDKRANLCYTIETAKTEEL